MARQRPWKRLSSQRWERRPPSPCASLAPASARAENVDQPLRWRALPLNGRRLLYGGKTAGARREISFTNAAQNGKRDARPWRGTACTEPEEERGTRSTAVPTRPAATSLAPYPLPLPCTSCPSWRAGPEVSTLAGVGSTTTEAVSASPPLRVATTLLSLSTVGARVSASSGEGKVLWREFVSPPGAFARVAWDRAADTAGTGSDNRKSSEGIASSAFERESSGRRVPPRERSARARGACDLSASIDTGPDTSSF